MAKLYNVTATITGSKYLGLFEAENAEAAEKAALASEASCISLCHQCSRECEDPTIIEVVAEIDNG